MTKWYLTTISPLFIIQTNRWHVKGRNWINECRNITMCFHRDFRGSLNSLMFYDLHSHHILTQLNTYFKQTWTEDTKWANVFGKNAVHPSSRVPHTLGESLTELKLLWKLVAEQHFTKTYVGFYFSLSHIWMLLKSHWKQVCLYLPEPVKHFSARAQKNIVTRPLWIT